ncbi:sugar kinase [Microbacterium stercoris]|uniref:Sugar kinase n=1 Tax=Microbacterium stercoris TaxID=2820289 RepID=A0A939TWK8_9MICO|nr:sugar kinase [Microbacterium stercoris]MBO3662762.1 sugar kinase [Microbacterium stercoris]
MTGLVTVGESLALVYGSRAGGFDAISDASVSFGGAESNVAIAAARLGAESTWIGRVGDDAFGRRITRAIRGEGVRVHATVDPERPTALMVKDRPAIGRTRVVYYRAGNAGSRIAPDDVPQDVVSDADIFHFTGISLALGDQSAATVLAAARAAKAAGVTVSFDLNHRSKLWSTDAAGAAFREVLDFADIVFAGDDEAALAVGDGAPEELADRIAAYGAREVVIKLGERGALALVNGVTYEQPPYRVEVADTVGAGDAFVGGYLAEHLAGAGLAQRMATAAAAGACACRGDGDWEMMPTRRDISELLAGGDPVSR